MRFKQFLESTVEKFEDLIHHIAEEELVACKVHHVIDKGDNRIDIHADCQDVPREEGFQPDLTQKVQQRLRLHPMQRLNTLTCRVYHDNEDEFQLEEGWKDLAIAGLVAGGIAAGTMAAKNKDEEGLRVINGVKHHHAPFAVKNRGTLPANVEEITVDGRKAYRWTTNNKGQMHFWTYADRAD
jgi:hypothetical protein